MNNIVFYFSGLIAVLISTCPIGLAQESTTPTQEPNASSSVDAPESKISFKRHEKSIDVIVDGEPFTTFNFGDYAKPILYPILGPGQIGMTRNWPMKEGVAGEAHDHPHHKSMWVAHEINGVDFWGETAGTIKTIVVDQPGKAFAEKNAIRATSSWVRNSDEKTLLTDKTSYRFGVGANSRWIDCTITFMASHGDFQFDDTKEGLFAIRTHPDLRLTAKPKNGVAKVFGSAFNSNGDTGKKLWGKAAKWVVYQGPVNGTPMSIAMYDDPDNLRHPTTWHARDYGLVTANPFGLHHFQGKEKGAGTFVVKEGDSLTLHYRVEFIDGMSSKSNVEERYKLFCDVAKNDSQTSKR